MNDGTYVIVCAVLLVAMLFAIPIRVKSKAVSVQRTLTTEASHAEERVVVAQLIRKVEWVVGAVALVIMVLFLAFGYILPRDGLFEFEARLVWLIFPVAIAIVYCWRTTRAYGVARRVESEYARATKGGDS